MKILLTGGAGYVGSACLRWLLDHGHDPIAYDNLSEGNPAAVPEAPARLIVGDIADTDRLAEVDARARRRGGHALRGAGLGPRLDRRSRRLLPRQRGRDQERARRDAARRRVRGSSSAARRRPTASSAEMPLREDSPQIPETPYGTTKLAAEWLIKDYARAYGLGYTLLRYFNASGADPDGDYGEDRRHEGHLIPLILQVAVGRRREGPDLRRRLDPTRDGTCVRDYVHTDDLAQAHQLAVEALEPGDGPGVQPRLGDRRHGARGPPGLRGGRRPADPARVRRPTARRPGDADRQPREDHPASWAGRPATPTSATIAETAWRLAQHPPRRLPDGRPLRPAPTRGPAAPCPIVFSGRPARRATGPGS